jgi:hypothetical protein
MTRLRFIFSTLVIGLLTLPATAFAGTDGTNYVQPGTLEGGGGVTEQAGSLPFTGLNLALILLAGAVLIATGLLLRRRAASSR